MYTDSAPEDRKSTRLNSSHTVIYTLSLHDALPIFSYRPVQAANTAHHPVAAVSTWCTRATPDVHGLRAGRSEEHTSELQSHSDLHSFPTRRSSDLFLSACSSGEYRSSPRSGGIYVVYACYPRCTRTPRR